MTAKKRWLWVFLFVLATLILATLATAFNVVLVRDYTKLVELAKSISHRELEPPSPWWSLALGTLGFTALLGGLILFFVRLLREMQLNQTQSEFLASVTHALKTPIATLELAGSLLRSGELSEEERANLWASHKAELERLKEQVETLLEAARWESASVSVSRTGVRIEDWLQASLPRWRSLLGPDAKLDRQGEPLECVARVDLRVLALITDNLIDNARKFSRDAPSVTVRSELVRARGLFRKSRWRVTIADQGWGFEPADQKKIFKRFVRAKSRAPYAIPGTGLGLYLASSAAQILGLKLSGESAGAGHGAAFVLEGPARC